MKKLIKLIFAILLVVALFVAWKVFGPTLKQPEEKFIYIKTGSIYSDVVAELKERKVMETSSWFALAAKTLKYSLIKPGKYEIKKGMSVFNLVRMLKNGRQTPVDLVVIKFRTKEDFAHRIGKEFETDSTEMMGFLNNNDSLRHYGLDTNTWTCAIIPDTYGYFWNSTPSRIFSKLYAGSEKFWTGERIQKLKANNLDPRSGYILASIIEEESNSKEEKPEIASVYLNRLARDMPLQADPTIKFAMQDFTIKRVYEKYLFLPSPYNTYLNKGLPPGPICTPSVESIDAVVNAPKTDYLYFVANSDLNGGTVFASTYAEHMKNAHLYQQALNKQDSIRKSRLNN